jgi:hypothetical protein
MDKLAALRNIHPVKVAQAIGALHALAEANYSVKEAAEYLGTTEDVVEALAEAARQ